MFLHNLRIAWKSMQRNAALLIIVLGIALGIALSTTFAAAAAFAQDPHAVQEQVLRAIPPRQLGSAEGLPG